MPHTQSIEDRDKCLAAIAARYREAPVTEMAATDALSDLVVVPTLREAIVGNLLKPGSRLLETQLSQQLGVSRTPLREAFVQLEREGLVTIIARVGVFVREVSEVDIDVDLDSTIQLKWIVSKVDKVAYEKTLADEAQAIKVIRMAEFANKRNALREGMLGASMDEIKALPIAALNGPTKTTT